jgi:tRNA(Ile)-lysidine synthase
MTRCVIAVSGGVDSVALLDMVAKRQLLDVDSDSIIVAHFDHGIRSDSAEDALFVAHLARTYGFLFETARVELGRGASEEKARLYRYRFLRDVAKRHGAIIVTAHHADDVVETIAINMERGTGWRGLAVLDSPDITRPLLSINKKDLLAYAQEHQLEWREDSTNADTRLLRNDIRQRLEGQDEDTVRLLGLYRNRQVALKKIIDNETEKVLGEGPYDRHLFIYTPQQVARELLRAVLIRETGVGATRPQLDRALIAVKTLHPGKRHVVSDHVTLRFSKTQFVID